MFKRIMLLASVIVLGFVLTDTVMDVRSDDTPLPPLTEPGPYGVVMQQLVFVDENRLDWEVETYVWYPVDKSQGTPVKEGSPLMRGIPPDMSGAPYPVILYSEAWLGGGFAELFDMKVNLASHGYVIVAPIHREEDSFALELINRPLDFLIVIKELSAMIDGDLVGMMDMNNIGLMGYNRGAEYMLQMIPLLLNPISPVNNWCYPDFDKCNLILAQITDSMTYETFPGVQYDPGGWGATYAGDDRIRAVFVVDPCTFMMTTDEILSTVDIPVMILHGIKNKDSCDYYDDGVRLYEALPEEYRYLISSNTGIDTFIKTSGYVPEHFAAAFFGYYLQGDENYGAYLTEENLPDWEFPELYWGVYEGE